MARRPTKVRLKRPCKRCGTMFRPSGPACWICNFCKEITYQSWRGPNYEKNKKFYFKRRVEGNI